MRHPLLLASLSLLSFAACAAPMVPRAAVSAAPSESNVAQDSATQEIEWVEEVPMEGDVYTFQETDELNSYTASNDVPDGERWHGSVTFPLGYQSVDNFGDIDELAQIGLFNLSLKPPGSPVDLVVQMRGGFTSDLPDESSTGPFAEGDDTLVTQFNLGVRHVWRGSSVQPYLGGGVSVVSAGVYEDDHHHHDDNDLDSDTDFAGWIGGGLLFTSGSGFLIGLNAQYLMDAEVELEGTDYDLEGLSVAIELGYGF